MKHSYPISSSVDFHGVARVEIRENHSGPTAWTTFHFVGEDGSNVEVTAFGIDGKHPTIAKIEHDQGEPSQRALHGRNNGENNVTVEQMDKLLELFPPEQWANAKLALLTAFEHGRAKGIDDAMAAMNAGRAAALDKTPMSHHVTDTPKNGVIGENGHVIQT